MADHVNTRDPLYRCRPAVGRLAYKLDVHRTTIQRRLMRLRHLGFLLVDEPATQHRPTVYRIDLDAGERKPRYQRSDEHRGSA